jgi:CRISPR-associated protein Cmr5
MKTRSQEYAAAVYVKVKAVKDSKNKTFHDDYLNLARKLPILIRSAGLMQALAFVQGNEKKEVAWQQLLRDLAAVVRNASETDLLTACYNAEIFEYMHLTKKTLDALVWFKRFAESMLEDKTPDTSATQTHAATPDPTPAQEAQP